MKYIFDLFVILTIVSSIIFCFMELGLVWGLVSLAVGVGLLLFFIQKRTNIFE